MPFCLTSFCHSIHKNKNRFLTMATVCVKLACSTDVYVGFFPGMTPVSSHIMKMCTWGELVYLNCLGLSECGVCVSGPAMEGNLVQGWVWPWALSCQDGLWPSVILNWNKQLGISNIISIFNIRSALGLYLEIWWCFMIRNMS